MFNFSDNSPRLNCATRLLLGASAATLGLALGAPAMAQTALPPVQVAGPGDAAIPPPIPL